MDESKTAGAAATKAPNTSPTRRTLASDHGVGFTGVSKGLVGSNGSVHAFWASHTIMGKSTDAAILAFE